MDDKETGPGHGRSFGAGRAGGRIITGLFLVVVGGALLLEQLGFDLPWWLFKWNMMLIIIGLFLGFKSNFQGAGWLIMIALGSIFLFEDIFPDVPVHRFSWPVVLIAVGLLVIVRPRRGRPGWRREDYAARGMLSYKPGQETYSSEDYIDSTTFFGGVHKRIVSKNFMGGDVVSIMGGTEINLSQADINGFVILEITQVMGGTKLIVPAHWEIRSEVSAIFAGFEDKRNQGTIGSPDKVLVLKGVSVFGGIEIRNY